MTEPSLTTWRGLHLWASTDRRGVMHFSLDKRTWYPTPRAAIKALHGKTRVLLDEDGVQLLRCHREFGAWREYVLRMTDPECFETGQVTFDKRPSAFDISLYRARARARLPDRQARTELGWRAWETKRIPTHRELTLDELLECEPKYLTPVWSLQLISPHRLTLWPEAELRVPSWNDSSVIRGASGIHARRMPRDWRLAGWFADGRTEGPAPSHTLVHGIVERFGRFVLGTTGWRAEWVVIRELEAPTAEIAAGLRQTYPEVLIHLKGDYST